MHHWGVVWNTQQQIQQFSSKKWWCIVRDIHNIFICHPKLWSAIFPIHLDLMVEATPFQNTFPSPSWWLRCVFGGKMFYQDKSCAQCIEVSSFWCHLLQIINCSMPNLPKVIMCTKVSKTWPLHQRSWRWTFDRNEQMVLKEGQEGTCALDFAHVFVTTTFACLGQEKNVCIWTIVYKEGFNNQYRSSLSNIGEHQSASNIKLIFQANYNLQSSILFTLVTFHQPPRHRTC